MVTALDELRALDERRRAELRAAEAAEARTRAETDAAVRARMEAEEELRRQQRSRAEAQAWAEAALEVEAARARHAAEDRARIEAIEAEVMTRARARLAEERATFEAALTAGAAGPRPRRGWAVAAAMLAAAVVLLGLWLRQQASSLDDAIAARVAAQRVAEDAGARVARLSADLRTTLSQVGELRIKIEEMRDRRPTPAPAPAAAPAPSGPSARPTPRPAPPAAPPRPITVCTDSPLC